MKDVEDTAGSMYLIAMMQSSIKHERLITYHLEHFHIGVPKNGREFLQVNLRSTGTTEARPLLMKPWRPLVQGSVASCHQLLSYDGPEANGPLTRSCRTKCSIGRIMASSTLLTPLHCSSWGLG